MLPDPVTGIAYLAVPVEHYPEAVRWLADRLSEEAPIEQAEEDAVLFGAAAVNGPADEVEAGATWSVEDLARLASTQTKTTLIIGALMDVLAEQPGKLVPTSELVERLDVERNSLRNALSKLTRHLKAHYDGHGWPFAWQWGPHLGGDYAAEMHYEVTSEIAERWHQARNA